MCPLWWSLLVILTFQKHPPHSYAHSLCIQRKLAVKALYCKYFIHWEKCLVISRYKKMKYKSFLVRKFNLGHLYIYIFPFCADIQFLGIPVIIDYADNRIYPSSTPSSKILFVNEYTRKYILFRLIVRLNRERGRLWSILSPRSQRLCRHRVLKTNNVSA